MESLLCDEVWVMSPNVAAADEEKRDRSGEADGVVEKYRKEDCEEAFRILLEKEASYMPEPGYANHLKLNSLIDNARFKAVHWLIRSQRRFNLSFGSVFDAVNYLDRFISLKKCQEWKCWVFDLLSVACLSVANKFNETDPPPLHEIQMEGLENYFGSNLIQRMELTLLEALGWRLSSTTPYSYLHLLTLWNTSSFEFKETPPEEELRSHITEMLLGALLDPKFLEFRPCVIAETALKCSLEEFVPPEINKSCFNYFTSLIPQDQKNDLKKCQMMMDEGLIRSVRTCGRLYCPSSPVTVLTTKQCDLCHCQLLDCSLFVNMQTVNINFGSSIRKRKRELQDNSNSV